MHVEDIDPIEVLDDWAEKLLSGQYEQCAYRLRTDQRFCVFGVLAETLISFGFPMKWIPDRGEGRDDGFHDLDSRGRKKWKERRGRSEGWVLRYMNFEYRRELPYEALWVAGLDTTDTNPGGGLEWFKFIQNANDYSVGAADSRFRSQGKTFMELAVDIQDYAKLLTCRGTARTV